MAGQRHVVSIVPTFIDIRAKHLRILRALVEDADRYLNVGVAGGFTPVRPSAVAWRTQFG